MYSQVTLSDFAGFRTRQSTEAHSCAWDTFEGFRGQAAEKLPETGRIDAHLSEQEASPFLSYTRVRLREGRFRRSIQGHIKAKSLASWKGQAFLHTFVWHTL